MKLRIVVGLNTDGLPQLGGFPARRLPAGLEHADDAVGDRHDVDAANAEQETGFRRRSASPAHGR